MGHHVSMSDEPAGDKDVLANLPRTRPARRSAKRDGAPQTPKPKPAAKAKPKAKTAPKPRAPRRTAPSLTPPDPVAQRPDGPPAAGYAVPEPDPHPASGDLLVTAAQAALELARLGVSLAVRALRTVAEYRPGSGGSAGAGDDR